MTTPTSVDPGRLNGWKEIAAHIGKGARTAQRWEKEYGLPVHRLGREGGEIVFAFRDEIDRWSRRTAGDRLRESDAAAPLAPPAEAQTPEATRPERRWPRWVWTGIAVVLAAAAGLLWADRSHDRAHAAGPPAAWRLANGTLSVLDAAGRTAFVRRLDGPTGPPVSSADVQAPRNPPVQIADLDGDDRPEVLLRVPAPRREDRLFYCFEADGRLRFVDRPRGSMRFGDAEYGEPWLAHRHFVSGPRDARSLYTVFTHNLWFPSRVRRLDARGRLLSEYWSNGFVEVVNEVTWRGRPVVLVGGAGNDARGASLAVFDAAAVSGHAPSWTAAHACHGCPDGVPLERLTFPTMCLLARQGGLAAVVDAWVDGGDRLTVSVLQGRGDPAGGEGGGEVVVFYTLGPDLSLARAEVSPEFQALHARLEELGLVDHAFGPRDDASMFPVLRSGPEGFRPVPEVKVAH